MMQIDLDYPTLQAVVDGNETFATNRHVFEVGEKHKVR
jgi:3-keto-L-gulonate-6-phosphate decarboxylase